MNSAPLRVAVVVPSLTRAGAEHVAQTLAGEFSHTAEVTVVTMEPRLSEKQVRELNDLPWADVIPTGCQHIHLPSTGSGLTRLLPLIFRFGVVAKRQRFDAVYSFLTWTNILVAMARILGGRFVHIASEHGMADSLRSDGGRLAFLAKALPLIYRLPHRVVVVSDAARDSLIRSGVLRRPERAVTIPNPIDAVKIRALASAPLSVVLPVSNEKFVLTCIARLHEQKDHNTLLRAMTRLPDSYILFLAGEGPLRSQLTSAIHVLGLEDRVKLIGMLSNPYPLMRRADLVILPSREEGFGLVAAESAALGVAFLGSNVGGLAEVCNLLGLRTFSVGDDHALADAITEMTSSNYVKSHAIDMTGWLFDPAAIASRYLQLLDVR